ncbi:MAG TPA: aldehyde dehydrogenase family protein, partial [Candidatus Polarisedimenticolaceae bacterium]|nr:aldehyde dehydrogenase family protein [Candidatus Polarisedimenticolaceae bacterium]
MTPTAVADTLAALSVAASSSGASSGTWRPTQGPALVSENPATGAPLGRVAQATADDYEAVVAAAEAAFATWRMVPAPKRGEVVRQLGEELRARKEELSRL